MVQTMSPTGDFQWDIYKKGGYIHNIHMYIWLKISIY